MMLGPNFPLANKNNGMRFSTGLRRPDTPAIQLRQAAVRCSLLDTIAWPWQCFSIWQDPETAPSMLIQAEIFCTLLPCGIARRWRRWVSQHLDS